MPVPPWTTETIIAFSSAAVFGLIARPSISDFVSFTIEPSGPTIRWTTYGRGTTPLFAIVDATIAIWSGVTSIRSCPNASRPASTRFGSFGSKSREPT